MKNSITLHHDETGDGPPLVLVHGSWSDRDNWALVAAGLAESFHVVACDRRNHGLSPRGLPGTRADQEDDIAALIEYLGRGPAHVAGTSFGGSIALGLAARHPDLVRSVVAHEPPLTALVPGHPALDGTQVLLDAVLTQIRAGDAPGAAQRFAEDIAFGPGMWALLPDSIRATMIDTAPAFAAEQQDPGWNAIDADALAGIECPVLLTQGDQSPPWFPAIVARLAELVPSAGVHTYEGAGHAPHISHPGDYVVAVTERTLEGAIR